MKALMKQVGGNGRGHKKARVWNMAQFQPRRWHREQAQAAEASPEPLIHESIDPSIQPVPLPLIHESTNPPIQSSTPSNPPIQPVPPPSVSSVPSVPSQANLPNPPEPTDTQHEDKSSKEKNEIKNSFIALRSQGWSLRSISKKLGVPKSTLFDWESDAFTRRSIKVLKSLHVERLQEQHLPAFEDELVKLSTFLARIERALEKHDFESMRPEFLLRTSLQLRARLQKLRIDTNPSATLDNADVPEINCGRLYSSEAASDDAKEFSGEIEPQSDPLSESYQESVVNSSSDRNENSDTNKNCELSQPSSPTTSADKVGTAVRLSGPITPEQTPSPLTEDANTDHPAVTAVNTPEHSGQTGTRSPLQNHEISFAAGFDSSGPRPAPNAPSNTRAIASTAPDSVPFPIDLRGCGRTIKASGLT